MVLDMFLFKSPKIPGIGVKALEDISLHEMEPQSALFQALEPYAFKQRGRDNSVVYTMFQIIVNWTAAVHIHAWLENNVKQVCSDGVTLLLHKEDIEELLKVCQIVIESLDKSRTKDAGIKKSYVRCSDGVYKEVESARKLYIDDEIAQEYLPPRWETLSEEVDSHYYDETKYTEMLCRLILDTFDFDSYNLTYEATIGEF